MVDNKKLMVILSTLFLFFMVVFLSGCATKSDIRSLEYRMNDDYDALTVKLNYHISIMDSRIDGLDAKFGDLNLRSVNNNRYEKAARKVVEKMEKELNANH